MREHQIVITLKPEQFLEVQRLARAANAKSMGIYVRQQLLAALGVEAGSTGPAKEELQDVEPVIGQIRRLHSELKTFVAESLSLYNVEATDDKEPADKAEKRSEGPVAAASSSDQLETVAERTFAISPRLGSIGADFEDSERTAFPRLSTPVGQTAQPGARHETHRRDSQRNQHGYGTEVGQTQQQSQPLVADPLDKLLPKEEEFKPANQLQLKQQPIASQSVPDDNLVPPSLAERKRQLAEGVPIPVEDQSLAEINPEPTSEASETAFAAEPSDTAAQSAQQKTSVPVQSESNPVAGRTPGYPSLSGSPPPKRRQL